MFFFLVFPLSLLYKLSPLHRMKSCLLLRSLIPAKDYEKLLLQTLMLTWKIKVGQECVLNKMTRGVDIKTWVINFLISPTSCSDFVGPCEYQYKLPVGSVGVKEIQLDLSCGPILLRKSTELEWVSKMCDNLGVVINFLFNIFSIFFNWLLYSACSLSWFFPSFFINIFSLPSS